MQDLIMLGSHSPTKPSCYCRFCGRPSRRAFRVREKARRWCVLLFPIFLRLINYLFLFYLNTGRRQRRGRGPAPGTRRLEVDVEHRVPLLAGRAAVAGGRLDGREPSAIFGRRLSPDAVDCLSRRARGRPQPSTEPVLISMRATCVFRCRRATDHRRTPQSNARRGLVVAQRQDVRPELALDHFQCVQALDQGVAEALVLDAKHVERRPVARRPQHVDAVRAVGLVREARRLVVGQPPAAAVKRRALVESRRSALRVVLGGRPPRAT